MDSLDSDFADETLDNQPSSVRALADNWWWFLLSGSLLVVGLLFGPYLVEILTAPGHAGRIQQIAFSPDDSRLFTCGDDGRFLAWSPSGWVNYRYEPVNAFAVCFALDPQGQWAAVSLGELPGKPERVSPGMALLDPATGRVFYREFTGNVSYRTLVANRDGTRLFAAHEKGLAALAVSRNAEGDFVMAQPPLWHVELAVRSLAVSPRDELAVGLEDGTILRVDPATGESQPAFERLKYPISSLSWSRDGGRLAAVGYKQEVGSQMVVWDAASGAKLAEQKTTALPQRMIAFSADPQVVAFGGDDQELTIARIAGGRFEPLQKWPCDQTHSLSFAHTGPRLAAANDFFSAGIYDTDAGLKTVALPGKMPGTEFDFGFAQTIFLYAAPAVLFLGGLMWYVSYRAEQHALALSARMQEFAPRMRMKYHAGYSPLDPDDFRGLPLFQQGEDQQLYDVLEGSSPAGPFFFAHYHYVTVSRGKKRSRTPHYFRLFLFPQADANLPAFRLAPASMSEFFGELFGDAAIPLTGTAIAEEFDRHFNLRAGNAAAALALFTPDRMRAMLDHRDWHLQSAQGNLVLWRDLGMFETTGGGPTILELDDLDSLFREAQAIASIFIPRKDAAT